MSTNWLDYLRLVIVTYVELMAVRTWFRFRRDLNMIDHTDDDPYQHEQNLRSASMRLMGITAMAIVAVFAVIYGSPFPSWTASLSKALYIFVILTWASILHNVDRQQRYVGTNEGRREWRSS